MVTFVKCQPVFYWQTFPEPFIHDTHSELQPDGLASEQPKSEAVKIEDDDLTIAWRYKNLSLTVSPVDHFVLIFCFSQSVCSVENFGCTVLFYTEISAFIALECFIFFA